MEDLRTRAESVAAALKSTPDQQTTPSAGGSAQRRLPEELRLRFVEVRAELFRRGIFDPVLVRFDSASVTPASNAEIGEQLARIAAALS